MARRFNITIDHATTANNSDRDSLSSEEEEEEEEEEERGGGGEEEEDSAGTGVQVSPRSAAGSQEYSSDPQEEPEGSWTKVYADDIGPSDSASRPRTSNHQRPLVEAPQPGEARRPSYRRIITQERVHNVPHPRAPRAPPSETESVESHEEWRGYPQGPPQHYARGYQYPPAGYPSPGVYQYAAPSVISPGQQQMVLRGYPGYQASPPPGAGYFGPQVISGHEMMPHAPHPAFYQYPQQSFPISMSPPPAMYAPYPVYTPPPATPAPIPTPAPAPAPAAAAEKADLPAKAATPPPPDTSKDDEKFARLEKLFLDEKADRDAREAAAKKALEDAEAKAKSDKERADEIKEATTKAAAKAKEDAKKEFQKAADKAAAEAKAAEPPPAPKEKDKPIKFKDAIGRRFNFPFHMCNTWTVSNMWSDARFSQGFSDHSIRAWNISSKKPSFMLKTTVPMWPRECTTYLVLMARSL